MSNASPPPPWFTALQGLQIAATVALGFLGWHINREAESARQSIARIESALKESAEQRLQRESLERSRVQLFEQVGKALASKDARHMLAAKALVVSLVPAEDGFRVGLISALELEAPAEAKVQLSQAVAQERQFLQDQASVGDELAKALPASTAGLSLGRAYLVDVFHCTGGPEEAARRQQAGRIVAELERLKLRHRLRPFSEGLNASPGYRVSGLQLRHEGGEAADAQRLASELGRTLGPGLELRMVANTTPGYLSIFAC